MGTATETLNSRLGLDTTDFKTGLQAANRELRVLESGFRASVSTLGDWANSISGVELRQKSLNAQIDIQKNKIAALEENHKRLVETNGKTSISAKNAEVELNKETERLGKMQSELDGTVTALQNLHDGNDAAGRSTKELGEKQESLGRQFKRSWTEINSAIMVGKEAYRVLKQGVEETVGAFVKYADIVREVSQATGASAEDTSRLIQLTDDYKIEADDLNRVMKKMAGEGFVFTTESIAKLSDEYLKLNPGLDRQLFLTEKFGPQGIKFAEIMLQGGDAIRSQSAAISGHLILMQSDLDKAREYEKQQDQLKDSWDAFKISIGEKVTPGITDFLTRQNLSIRANELGIHWNTIGVALRSIASLQAEVTAAEQAHIPVIKEENDEIDRASDYMEVFGASTKKATLQTDMFGFSVQEGADALQQANEEFGFIINFARQYESNLKNVKSIEEELKQAEEELFAMSQPGWKGTADQVQTAQDKVDGLKVKLGEAQQASLDATNEMIAGFLQAQLTADGSFTEADIQKVLNYRLAVGLLTQEAYEAALEALNIAKNLASIPAEVNSNVNVNTNYTTTGALYNPVHGQAKGGDWLVKKPTLFLAGEAGLERATFTPLNSGMKTAVSQLEGAVRGLNSGLTPAVAGGGSNGQAAPINVTVQATVASDIDMYELSRKVADEIRRNK